MTTDKSEIEQDNLTLLEAAACQCEYGHSCTMHQRANVVRAELERLTKELEATRKTMLGWQEEYDAAESKLRELEELLGDLQMNLSFEGNFGLWERVDATLSKVKED